MLIGISMDHYKQQILRDMLLKTNYTGNQSVLMYECLNDLNLINSCEEILDDGITKGHTNWQLFGSRKPGHDDCKLTNKFTVNITTPAGEYDDGIDILENDLTIINIDLLKN